MPYEEEVAGGTSISSIRSATLGITMIYEYELHATVVVYT